MGAERLQTCSIIHLYHGVSTRVDLGRRNSSTIGTVLGALVTIVAIVGTQVYGWKWGSDQFVPTVVGVLAAAIAIALIGRRSL